MNSENVMNSNLSIKEQIGVIQRLILIHSYLYYELDNSYISDKEFDYMCKKLVEVQKVYGVEATYYEPVFHDFDGSTGFYLWTRLNEYEQKIIKSIAASRKNQKVIDRRKNVSTLQT